MAITWKKLAYEEDLLSHAARHQNGGADEISVAGLSGLLADGQHVLDAEVIAAVEAEATLDLTGDVTIDGELEVEGTNIFFKTQGILRSSTGYIYLRVSSGQDIFLDVGDEFLVRDVDDSYAIRLKLNSATGDFTLPGLGGGGNRYVYVDDNGKLIAGAAYP